MRRQLTPFFILRFNASYGDDQEAHEPWMVQQFRAICTAFKACYVSKHGKP